MSLNPGTSLTRVVIIAPSRQLEVALPQRTPLAALVPDLLQRAGEQVVPDVRRPRAFGGWVLRRADGTRLDPARPLAVQGLRDGAVLHLVPGDLDWPEPEYDDIVEAVAAGVRRGRPPWRAAVTRRAGLGAAFGVLVLEMVIVLRAGPPWLAPAGVLLGIGIGLLLAGAGLARAAGDSIAGAVFGVLGVPHLALGGFLILAGPEDSVSDLGAPHIVLAGVAAVAGALLGQVAVADGTEVFAAAVVVGAALTAGGLLGLSAFDGVQAAVLVLAVLTILHPVLPLLAIRMGKVPIPTVPQTPEDLLRDEGLPSSTGVIAAAQRANRLLAGLVLGISAASAACLLVTARAGGLAAPLLAGIVSVALLLQARIWRTALLRLPMLTAGGLGAGTLILRFTDSADQAMVIGMALPALLVSAVALAAAGLVYAGRPLSPYPGRVADILDALLVLAVMPVAAGSLGLYGEMLDVRQFLS